MNAIGLESGNAGITSGRTIPWLQDVPDQDVWTSWHVTWRDVIVLDQENRVVNIFNLTDHDLADSTNYATLRSILLEAAR